MSEAELFEAAEQTWPAAALHQRGNWLLREGRGGGKRVSCATTDSNALPDPAEMEQGYAALGQPPLVMLRTGQEALDQALDERGYELVDPVVIYEAPIARLTDVALPKVTAMPVWEPLAIMVEIWQAGGIGPARIDVMRRVEGPKTAFMGRLNERPAGAAFAAIHGQIAMVHAIEILAQQRRQGMGAWFMRAAGFWAAQHGAQRIAVMCTRANVAGNALYQSLGMAPVGGYHYRMKPEGSL